MLKTVGAACLAAITVFICLFLHAATVTVAAVPAEMDTTRTALVAEVRATRGDLVGQVTGLRQDLNGQLTTTREQLLEQVAALQNDAFSVVRDFRTTADQRIGDALARVDRSIGLLDGVREDLKPTLSSVAQITGHANEAAAILFRRDALPAQTLGLIAATKVTMGQTALTMRDIQNATPGLLQTMSKIGANSDATTAKAVAAAEETRQVMHNLAVTTTPLPKIIRYPAQVIGLLGSAAVPVVTLEKLSRVDTVASTAVRIVKQ